MKIYNYGNDYAFQRRQKSEGMVQASESSQTTIVKSVEETDAKDKIQTGGEGKVADAPQNDTLEQDPKTCKKKKGNNIKTGQLQENSQIQ